MHLDSPLALSPLTPPPPRPAQPPAEVFPSWSPAQRIALRHASAALPSIALLRSAGSLPLERARRIADWYAGPAVAIARRVELAYEALADEVATLAHAVTAPRAEGGLGVRVTLVRTPEEPYANAAALCGELRRRGTMSLRAAAVDRRHPVLRDETVDQLRTVHDVLGHAALGLGFDLQSEYAAWLYCCPLFSRTARPAAFCELVGAVASYVLTGSKPVLRADLPPPELLTGADTTGVPGRLGGGRKRRGSAQRR
jgi:hypothetical protein